MSDAKLAELARRAVDGNDEARDELLGELRPIVIRTARLVVGPGSAAAEDAAQEAVVDVMLGLRNLREPGAVRAWALTLTARRALKVARKERLAALIPIGAPTARVVEETPPFRPELKEAFYSLPLRMRAVAVFRLYVGLTEAETATALGSSVGAVKSQLHEARKRLMAALRTEGIEPAISSRGTEEG